MAAYIKQVVTLEISVMGLMEMNKDSDYLGRRKLASPTALEFSTFDELLLPLLNKQLTEIIDITEGFN